ncbi:MAG: sporulation membrane protein YtaF [Clostridiales bacterium]|nr:sporulation membrane protein YtaF [Clostridiales bacterium]
MDFTVTAVLEAVIIVVSLSLDAFVSSIAYGSNRIKIPLRSALVINIICTATLAVSLLAGSAIRQFIPAYVTQAVCFIILFILGFVKLCDSLIKSYIKRRVRVRKKIKLHAFNLNFILHIYASPEIADTDASSQLSPAEAVSLAFALSFDGLAVGLGAAMGEVNILLVVLCSLAVHMLAIAAGSRLGNRLAEKAKWDLSWLSGVMLILLAFMKLV